MSLFSRSTIGISALAAALLVPAFAASSAHAADINRNQVPDSWERAHGLSLARSAVRRDIDRDGLSTRSEFRARTNPRRADSDRDGIRDGAEHADRDGLTNAVEQRLGTHPRMSDTNRNGIDDGAEDRDRDGICNEDEANSGSNPVRPDSDDDGTNDANDDDHHGQHHGHRPLRALWVVQSVAGRELTLARPSDTTRTRTITVAENAEIEGRLCPPAAPALRTGDDDDSSDDSNSSDDDVHYTLEQLTPGMRVGRIEFNPATLDAVEIDVFTNCGAAVPPSTSTSDDGSSSSSHHGVNHD
jgi:hypothetical protein